MICLFIYLFENRDACKNPKKGAEAISQELNPALSHVWQGLSYRHQHHRLPGSVSAGSWSQSQTQALWCESWVPSSMKAPRPDACPGTIPSGSSFAGFWIEHYLKDDRSTRLWEGTGQSADFFLLSGTVMGSCFPRVTSGHKMRWQGETQQSQNI